MQKRSIASMLFRYGMWWRIFYGILRIAFGLVVLKIVGSPLIDILKLLMGHELVEDPSDILFVFAQNILVQHPVYISYFLSVYFIFWGVLDVVLSYNLLRGKMWAFPASLLFIGGFVIYELLRFTHTHSFILLWVVCIDIAIFWLIRREYKKLQLHSLLLEI